MDVSKMIGYKFFKEHEDGNIETVRIIKYFNHVKGNTIKVLKTFKDETEDCIFDVNDLKKYTPLQPVGMLMMSGVSLEGSKDVIISTYLLDRLENKDPRPFVICRQNITDVFYNLLIKDDDDMIAGLSMNILNIPQGFDYGLMMVSDQILFTNTT